MNLTVAWSLLRRDHWGWATGVGAIASVALAFGSVYPGVANEVPLNTPLEAPLRPPLPRWKKRRAALNQVYQVDEFRIYYTLTGGDRLPTPQDINRNGVPDRIENIALQLVAAREIYTQTFQLRHPLDSPRYRDRVQFIDVHVGVLPFELGGARNRGYAGDGIVNYYRPSDPVAGVEVLTIDIANTLPVGNLTPAHELFHLFQYGYTLFKTGWFLEGTARWIESALGAGAGIPGELPRSQAELRELFRLRYRAVGFWIAFAQRFNHQDTLAIPPGLESLTYVGTEQRVIKDRQFYGASIIRPLLEELDAMDDRVSREFQRDSLHWSETDQRSADNSPYIWTAILQLIDRLRHPSQET